MSLRDSLQSIVTPVERNSFTFPLASEKVYHLAAFTINHCDTLPSLNINFHSRTCWNYILFTHCIFLLRFFMHFFQFTLSLPVSPLSRTDSPAAMPWIPNCHNVSSHKLKVLMVCFKNYWCRNTWPDSRNLTFHYNR